MANTSDRAQLTITRETWSHICTHTTSTQRSKLVDAVLSYAFDGREPDYRLPDAANVMYPLFKALIDTGQQEI